jgi:hypothetical protein
MNTQPSLFDERAAPTVGTLNAIVLEIISDGRWRMPYELCDIILRTHKVRISDSSVTARLRDGRKAKFGSHNVEKRIREGSRAYEYRIVREEL